MTYVTNPEPPPALIPAEVEGLKTTGIMGTEPALTVGTIVAAVGFVVNLAIQYFGWTIPYELREFADQYGLMLAAVVLPILTAAIARLRVFSPHSAAEIQIGNR